MNSEKRSVLQNVRVATLVAFAIVVASCAYAQDSLHQECQIDVQNLFTPSGWMGDGEYGREYIDFTGACKMRPHSEPTCIKITYSFGPKLWAGIYWQNQPDNWGDKPGSDLSEKSIKSLSFWARGSTGEEVVEFKTGDISNSAKQYRDSYSATIGRVTLTKDWKEYSIDLQGADLSSVIGGFVWVASRDYNNQENITFFLDDICFR